MNGFLTLSLLYPDPQRTYSPRPMSKQISQQASKVSKLLGDPGTISSYKQALTVTIAILKETALLIWLVLCLGLVAIDWFWTNSIAVGRNARTWIEGFETTDKNELPNQLGQSMLLASQSSLNFLVTQAREQIGLPAKSTETLPMAKPAAIAPANPPKPMSPPSVAAPAAAPVAAPAAASSSDASPDATQE